MGIIIPSQLRKDDGDEFRFVLVRQGQKIPLEKGWNSTNNYSFSDPKLIRSLKSGNYGVCSGYGNLVVVDSDDPIIAERAEESLGVTFRVRSGSGRGYHDYYIVPNMQRGEIFERNGKHLGEARSSSQMVVGPGSIHPSGGIYVIVNDESIRAVTIDHFKTAFRHYVRAQNIYRLPRAEVRNEQCVGLQCLPLTAIFDEFKSVSQQRYINGKNPWHGARTGTNFSIDTHANLWTCWRCNCRGGVARAIALRHGLITACPHVLSKSEYREVVEIAKEKYGFK